MATFPGHKDVWVSLPRSKETSENMAKVSATVEQPGNSCQSHRVVDWWYVLCTAYSIVRTKLYKIKMVKVSRQNFITEVVYEPKHMFSDAIFESLRQVMDYYLMEN